MKLQLIEGHFACSSLFKLTAIGSGIGMLPFFILWASVFALDSGSTLLINEVQFTGLTASVFFRSACYSLVFCGIDWEFNVAGDLDVFAQEAGGDRARTGLGMNKS